MSEEFDFLPDENIGMTVDIVTAYVGNNAVAISDLPNLIREVYGAISSLESKKAEEDERSEELKPAVSIKKSITPDFLICLEDGQKFKSLKRHLRTHYNLTPEEYRERWGLDANYPMVAPNYARARSNLAKEMGLGQKRSKK